MELLHFVTRTQTKRSTRFNLIINLFVIVKPSQVYIASTERKLGFFESLLMKKDCLVISVFFSLQNNKPNEIDFLTQAIITNPIGFTTKNTNSQLVKNRMKIMHRIE